MPADAVDEWIVLLAWNLSTLASVSVVLAISTILARFIPAQRCIRQPRRSTALGIATEA
jgi:hypothetical protein